MKFMRSSTTKSTCRYEKSLDSHLKNLEELVRNFLKSSKEEIQTTPEFDKRVFNSAARAYQENLKNFVHRRLNKQKIGLTSAANELEKRRRDNRSSLDAALWRAS